MKTTLLIGNKKFDVYLTSANILAMSGRALVDVAQRTSNEEMLLISWGIMMLGLNEHGEILIINEISI